MFKKSYLLVGFLIFLPLSLWSQNIEFSESYTGADLVGLSNVTTPNTDIFSVSGNSVTLSSSIDYQPILQWDLVGAAPRKGTTIQVAISYTGTTADNDPRFMISDSMHAQGVSRIDQGEVWLTSTGIPTSSSSFTDTRLTSGLGSASSGITLSFELLLSDDVTQTSLSGYTENSFTQSEDIAYSSDFIDASEALSFILVSGNRQESYQIENVSIVMTTVPEPMHFSLALALLTVPVAIGFQRRIC